MLNAHEIQHSPSRIRMTITPDDSARLRHVGIVLLTNLAGLTTTTLLHGNAVTSYPVDVLTQLYCLTSVYRHWGLKSHPTLAIFILIILSFTATTIYWAAWMAAVAIQICSVLVKNGGMELSEKMALSNAAAAKPDLILMSLNPFMVL
ncbi:hypothetical protein L208DRAFT_1400453 [Tricholoma matsutake]|nr:hypothetical protein L208DRAFT_1400453 [Tricholoma matsutake 945]